MRQFTTDHVGSDDMDEILQMSLATSSSSTSTTYHDVQSLRVRVQYLEHELSTVDADIQRLQELRARLRGEKEGLVRELNSARVQGGISNGNNNGKGKAKVNTSAPNGVDYQNDTFDWSSELKARMNSVFGIQEFRLCQEGVCNANMDGRDIVCVMPTGGGKSLTYQLPALLNPGCTIVISPLISLITDQILHLREAGVEAVMLTGSTTKDEMRDIFSRLTASARGGGGSGSGGKEIKLCYVTPEKVAKSKTFVAMLEKLAAVGRLARIVIDEAHCVSQLGHDFRPDYKKLSILRQLFPRVPILALSATCPPRVLKDLLMTLRLGPISENGGSATSSISNNATIYFSAPLYRKNLHYKVLPKPASANKAIEVMKEYILKERKGMSGIVYCLSKKDAENVAEGLMQSSNGAIRTGVYHADVPDKAKEALHKRWRRGDVNVVCATIAFGLGIDKGDVRFVLHHSMSKSLDGYYQESGRAGRDGKDSDCILYYRPQDATRLSSLICGELEGQDKLHDMLRFAQELVECRKVQFAKYFSTTSSLSISSWSTDTTSALSKCGHCDNCLRPTESILRKDVTLETWQILRVIQTIERDGGRVTMSMLGDLVRGAGGGVYGVSSSAGQKGKKRKSEAGKEKVELDLEAICEGKVGLGKDATETLLVQLTLSQHLKESFHSTAYAINVYVLPGPNALRVARFSREDIVNGKGQRVECCFGRGKAAKGSESGKGGKSSAKLNARRQRSVVGGVSKAGGKTADKKKSRSGLQIGGEGDEEEDGGDIVQSDEDYGEDITIPDFPDETDEEDEDEEAWAFTMRSSTVNPPNLKSKGGGSRTLINGNDNGVKRRRVDRVEHTNADSDVIVLSD